MGFFPLVSCHGDESGADCGWTEISKSKWTPPDGLFVTVDFFLQKCRHDVSKLKFNRNSRSFNLKPDELPALLNLRNLSKRPTKRGAVVVWRTDLYQQEAFRQLSHNSCYCKVEKDLTSSNQNIVKETVHDLISKQELPATAQNHIITTPRTSVIYFKPKIHKPNNPGRPIVSAYSCPTDLISQYLDQIMSPSVKSLPSYIKDTNHALKTFRDFNFPGQNKLIFTMDITPLYSYPQPRRAPGTQIHF